MNWRNLDLGKIINNIKDTSHKKSVIVIKSSKCMNVRPQPMKAFTNIYDWCNNLILSINVKYVIKTILQEVLDLYCT